MRRKKTAILLAIGLGVTTVLSTACGNSGATNTAAEDKPAVEETAEAEKPAEEAAEAVQPAKEETVTAEVKAEQPLAAAGDQIASIKPAADQFHCELEEVGNFAYDRNYRVTYDSIVHAGSEFYTFCGADGKSVDDRELTGMDYLGWGLYSVTLKSEDSINSTGLVSIDGEVIIPFEAAIIEFPSKTRADVQPRYVLVFTGTEPTDNENEALFFATDRMFAIMAQEGDTYYKGTLKVFDLVGRQYVSGLEFSQGTDSDFAQIGDNIMTDLGDKPAVYGPDGKAVYTAQGRLDYNGNYFMERIDTTTHIFDADGKELYNTESILNVVDYSSDLFQVYNSGKYSVINCKGESALSGEWDYIYEESKGRFRVKNNGDTGYTLVAADNSVVAQAENLYAADDLGFYVYGDSTYTMISPGNRVVEGLEEGNENLVFTKDDGASYMIVNTGDFTQSPGEDADDIVKGAFTVENGGKKALYDAFTGGELLGAEYDEIDDINDDYIYAVKGGTMTVYKLSVVEN
ncbi:MAG: hypothetical protein J6E40_14175 [Lachnospiraceae bacterium]|nr:hypothetical protein [Lachnospiraceae bacterium]